MICLTGRSDISAPFYDLDERPCRSTVDRSSLYKLSVKRDSHLVADEDAAALEYRVPGQAEVFAVDLGGCRDCNSRIAPGILRGWRGPFNCKRHLAGDAANGQVALDL